MQQNAPKWANSPKTRIASGLLLLALVFFGAFRKGGREHFFHVLPTVALGFAKFAAIIYSVMFIQWALTKTALKRGWTTEEKLRKEQEALAHARSRSLWAALALFFWGMGAPMLLMWWFTNPIPGQPGLAKLDMVRIENAYWLMGLTEVIAFFVVLGLGLRWVQSRTGRVFHTIFSFISPFMFLAAYLFDRSEPNVILVIWAVTITIFPTLYVFMVFQSAMKRNFLKSQGPA